jgi:hypothetical protein
MSTKREVLDAALRGEGCLGKAADDEPVFVLRAQDITSYATIYEWSYKVENYAMSRKLPVPDKVARARRDAEAMMEWQRMNPGRAKMPD